MVYKSMGRQAAVLRGLALVGPRLGALAEEAVTLRGSGDGMVKVYCARGGARSAAVAWLLGTVLGCAGRVVVLAGGYRAFRVWVAERTAAAAGAPLAVIGGPTGAGKTAILGALRASGARTGSVCGGLHVHVRGFAQGTRSSTWRRSRGTRVRASAACLVSSLGTAAAARPGLLMVRHVIVSVLLVLRVLLRHKLACRAQRKRVLAGGSPRRRSLRTAWRGLSRRTP